MKTEEQIEKSTQFAYGYSYGLKSFMNGNAVFVDYQKDHMSFVLGVRQAYEEIIIDDVRPRVCSKSY